MAASATTLTELFFFVLILISFTISPAKSTAPEECEAESANPCVDKAKALPLKIISIVAILLTRMIGVSVPLFNRNVPFLHPDGKFFTTIRALASGIILGTSFMHVLPDSFEMLSSECLEDDPWHKFPFTGFVAILSGLVTLAIDSMATSFYTSKNGSEIVPAGDQERANPMITLGHSHGHGVTLTTKDDGSSSSLLLRYRVIAMVSPPCNKRNLIDYVMLFDELWNGS